MLIKNNFSLTTRKFYKNLNKTKKIFNSIKLEIKNFKMPFFQSYKKNYIFDFNSNTIRKFSKYDNIVIIGMGGSILGTKSIYSFFKSRIKKKVFFFDNLDANLNLQFKKAKKLKNFCFIIVSKSGDTLETLSNFCTIFSKSFLKNKLIIISEIKDSCLINIANKFNAEIIEHKDFIGGRFSVMSEVGMFPAALMGLKISKFKNLEQLIRNKNFVKSLIINVASIYTLITQGCKNSVILNYDTKLNDLCLWHQQLIGESLGKKGKGITPIISTCPRDHHSVMQLYLDGPKDKFFTFFSSLNKKRSKFKVSGKMLPNSMRFLRNKKLESIIDSQCQATKNVFKVKKIPYRHFVISKNNENELGTVFTFFVLETILLANLMKVNPFDQPAVEKIKIETKRILSK